MIVKILERALDGSPITVQEMKAVKILLEKCAPDFRVTKAHYSKKGGKFMSPVFELGIKQETPCNPASGYIYPIQPINDPIGARMQQHMNDYEICGQFAGKGQWTALGRKVKENEQPHFYTDGRRVNKETGEITRYGLFAFEQTEPM